jgi:ribosomal protein S18 acetylase RimI-like enzyme
VNRTRTAETVRELSGEELVATSRHPFVRHQVDPATTRRAWGYGDAVLLDGGRVPPGEAPTGPVYTCLGPARDLEPLLDHAAARLPTPWRVTLAEPARLPAAWPRPTVKRWHWMLRDGADGRNEPDHPAEAPEAAADALDALEVVEVEHAPGSTGAARLDALLDAGNPGSFARPGGGDVALWLGIHTPGDDSLLAAGALQRMVDGTLHLRGVTVLPHARGRGLGRRVSAALTDHALAHGSGVATLGVYVDNVPALRIYHDLGYRVVHTFSSGVVAPGPGRQSHRGSTDVAG